MAESGGPATQSGILYQNSVAALYLGRLLDIRERPNNETVSRVRVEAPGPVDDIVVTYADGHKAYIQVKENLNKSGEAWEKVWSDFKKQFDSDKFQKGRDRLCLYIGDHPNYVGLLEEICSRASSSENSVEWRDRLSKEQEELLQKIGAIKGVSPIEPSTLLDFFRHIVVETWTQRFIKRDLMPNWMPDSSLKRGALFQILCGEAANKARNRGSFVASELSDWLKREVQVTISSSPDLEALRESFLYTGSLLLGAPHGIGKANIQIPRSAVTDIVSWAVEASEGNKSVAMLEDRAGSGKTVVLRSVLAELQKRGVVALGIKADRQLSGINSISEIQGKLGLNQPLEQCISRLTKLGRVVVIIDQIDALSMTLAQDQRALNVALDLVERLRQIPDVRVIISCRTFDRNNDSRLRDLSLDKTFPLPALRAEEIQGVLSQVGVDYDLLSAHTRKLLTTPLHLALFVRVVEGNPKHLSNILYKINSLQGLYSLVWKDVVLRQPPQTPPRHERRGTLYLLVDYMDKEAQVSAPALIFHNEEGARFESAADWLTSEGIIIRDKQRLTLFHQTFFDYIYARRFVEANRDLAKEILESEQGLSERTKLIYVLSYLRESDTEAYLESLGQLLNNSGLRYHLKDLLLRWFGAILDPSEREWKLMHPLLDSLDMRVLAMNAIRGNTGWFQQVHDSFLSDWLQQDDSTDQLVVPYLISMLDVAQTQVMEIARELLGRDEKWDGRITRIFWGVKNWKSRETLDFYEMHFKRCSYESRLYQLIEVAEADPAVGCRLVGFVLNDVLDRYLEQHSSGALRQERIEFSATRFFFRNLDSLDDALPEEVIEIVSEREPRLFVEILLPWLQKVVTLHDARPDIHDSFADDSFSFHRHDDLYKTSNAIIRGMINALVKVAKTDSSFFNEVSDKLCALPYQTPQYLLVGVYTSKPSLFAAAACEFLSTDRRRLAFIYENRKLLSAIYPYLSVEQGTRLESAILSYAPIHRSLGVDALRYRGVEQLYLLQAIPRDSLSSAGLRRLEELERKFPEAETPKEPIGIRFEAVISPIPVAAVEKMSDKDWLHTMRKYQGGFTHKEFPKGGAQELGPMLAGQISKDPERFVRLFKRVPDDVDDAYVLALINGLADSLARKDLLFDTMRRFSTRNNRDIRYAITGTLIKVAQNDTIPDDLLTLLFDWLRGPMGENEQLPQGGDPHDLYTGYLNSIRGRSFRALMESYDFQDSEDSRQKKWALIELMADDDSAVLRLGAIYELMFLIRSDPSRSSILFDRLMLDHNELLGTEQVKQFIYYSLYRNFLYFAPYISAMMQHPRDDIKKDGAHLACIADLSAKALESDFARAEAHKLAQSALSGPPAWRRGAAMAYANNIIGDSMETCMRNVIRLLDDDDEEVLRSINQVFSRIKEEKHMQRLREFFNAYANAVKLFDGGFSRALFNYGSFEPMWTLSMIQAYAGRAHSRVLYIYELGLSDLLRLVLRIYNNSQGSVELRKRAMDIFDSLMEIYPAQAYETLEEWDAGRIEQFSFSR